MPTYDYECQKCKHKLEVFQKISAPAPKECPRCKAKNSLKKMIGAGCGLIFKGSGFYATDYKKNKAQDTKGKHTKPKEK